MELRMGKRALTLDPSSVIATAQGNGLYTVTAKGVVNVGFMNLPVTTTMPNIQPEMLDEVMESEIFNIEFSDENVEKLIHKAAKNLKEI
jgi:hypothetical protein